MQIERVGHLLVEPWRVIRRRELGVDLGQAKAGLDDEDHEHDEDCEHDEDEDAQDSEEAPEIPIVEGEAFEFYTAFTAYPRPELPDVSGLKLRRPVAEVTVEQVDERLGQLREINAADQATLIRESVDKLRDAGNN